MSYYGRLKALERKKPKPAVYDKKVTAEVEAMVSEAVKDLPQPTDNRLEECKTVKEIAAELERIVYS